MLVFNNILRRSIDAQRLSALLAMPQRYMGQGDVKIIPSLSMTNEGPVLTKIFLITETYLCEVQVGEIDTVCFDIIDVTSVANIRVAAGIDHVSDGQEIIASYKTATVSIIHASSMSTTLDFVGDDRDEWLSAVLATFPATSTIRRQ